jgi:S-formylglutathione hydrolase FrmB
MANRRYPGVTAWFAAGAQDPPAISVAHRLATAAANAGIVEHELTVAGAHNWQYAAAAFNQILPQLCIDLGCGGSRATRSGGPAQ